MKPPSLNAIKDLVNQNWSEVEMVIDTHLKGIANSFNLKFLLNKVIVPFWESRPQNHSEFILLCFQEHNFNDTIELDPDALQKLVLQDIREVLVENNLVIVDLSFNIAHSAMVNTSEELVLGYSRKNLVVFFLGPAGVEVAIKGHKIDRVNIFYNEADRRKYKNLHTIETIQDCLKEYEKHIAMPGVNEGFFVSKTTLANLRAKGHNLKNVLVNKPELRLRDNLIQYLQAHTQNDFLKEPELSNRRELDLFTEHNNKKYLIEVKWVGQSVHENEQDLGVKYSDADVIHGVIQTLEYIETVTNAMNFSLQCAYLLVFDVRDNKSQPVNYKNFDIVNTRPDLIKHFTYHFKKLDEIKLDNTAKIAKRQK